jgi:hypothetical protein
MFFGTPEAPTAPRRIALGEPGDLCILGAPPEAVLAELDSGMVTTTIVAGNVIHGG